MRLSVIIVIAGIFSGLPSFGRDRAPAKHPAWKADNSAPLEAINRLGQKLYGRMQALGQEYDIPEVYVSSPAMILRLDGLQHTEHIIPPAYTRLKSISHSVQIACALAGLKEAGKDVGKDLGRLLKLLPQIKADLLKVFPAEQVSRQEQILNEVSRFARELQKKNGVSSENREAFFRKTEALVSGNLADAAEARVRQMAGIMRKWRRMMGEKRWRTFRVVVAVPKISGEHQLAVRFFAGLLKTEPDHPRLLVVEGVFRLENLRKVAAAWHADQSPGSVYFREFGRLRRDIPGEAEKDYLKSFDWNSI